MNRHLLVTVGDDAAALDGARFVTRFFTAPRDLNLTFFHTTQDDTLRRAGADGAVVRNVTCAVGDDSVKQHDPLERVRRYLCDNGFGGGMEAKIFFRRYSSIADLVVEGEKGLYDAIVLGRRELLRLEDAYGGDAGAVRRASTAPLWLCGGVEDDRNNVLLCVDGSAPSVAMADHVGYMLSGDPGQRVMLLAVGGSGPDAPGRAMHALERGTAALLTAGFDEERLDAKIVDEGPVGRTILAEAEAGRFAVVALGRTGAGLGRDPGMFLGSASGYLIERLRGAALWLCG